MILRVASSQALRRLLSGKDPIVRLCSLGYIREHHLRPRQRVRGVIISHGVNQTLRYAIKAIPNVELFTYEVELRVRRTN